MIVYPLCDEAWNRRVGDRCCANVSAKDLYDGIRAAGEVACIVCLDGIFRFFSEDRAFLVTDRGQEVANMHLGRDLETNPFPRKQGVGGLSEANRWRVERNAPPCFSKSAWSIFMSPHLFWSSPSGGESIRQCSSPSRKPSGNIIPYNPFHLHNIHTYKLPTTQHIPWAHALIAINLISRRLISFITPIS